MRARYRVPGRSLLDALGIVKDRKVCSLQVLVTCKRPKHYTTTQWREYTPPLTPSLHPADTLSAAPTFGTSRRGDGSLLRWID